jgi:transposase-like protein
MNHAVNDPTSLFQRCHFDSTVIILCIRWYITYKRSYRDLVAIMAERNVDVVYPTIMHWVQIYSQSSRRAGSDTLTQLGLRGESMKRI